MPPSLPISQRKNLDAESRALIYGGCSVNQLAEIFNMRVADVAHKLGGLDAVGVGRQGNPLYRISDAATRLVKIPVTPEMMTAYMKRMNPKDLPPLLNKLFWDSMTARRKYEEFAGELWLSSDVLQVASEAFQSLRMSLLLVPDQLRDQTQITDTQIRMVQNVIDTALEAARERLVDHLRKPGGSRSRSAAEEEPL